MQNALIVHPDSIITFLKPYGRELDLRIGEVIRAEVLNVMSSGDVALRISRKGSDSLILMAKSDIPLTKGTSVFFKVSATDSEIRLQYMGPAVEGSKPEMPAEGSLPQRIRQMLDGLAGSKMKAEDLRFMEEALSRLPEKIKDALPELRALERLMPEIGKLSSELLRRSVEESGLLFETKLRLAVQGEAEADTAARLKEVLSGSDHKLDLLRLKAALQEGEVIEAMRTAGVRPAELSATVDKLIRNLEYFQLSSHIGDAVYTFLPLAWQELREGELSFRKNRDSKGSSYSCDISLDLNPAGKLSISVSLFEDAFYVTFYTEDAGLSALIEQGKEMLEQRFSSAGLILKAVNISQKGDLSFGAKKEQGVSIRI
ncbi:MAG: flagellar hook-length control protein FliK [Nitrospirales bacterium]|nr:flagellar hook-length control protein FliK [Nitrospirales bacterium]